MEQVVVGKEKYDHLVRLAESEYGPDSTDYDFTIVPEDSVVVDRARFERLQRAAHMAVGRADYKGSKEKGMWLCRLEPTDLDPLP